MAVRVTMPAPLPSATRAPWKAMLSTLNCPFTNTQIALPSALRPSAWSTGRVPRPRISRDFWFQTATSPR